MNLGVTEDSVSVVSDEETCTAKTYRFSGKCGGKAKPSAPTNDNGDPCSPCTDEQTFVVNIRACTICEACEKFKKLGLGTVGSIGTVDGNCLTDETPDPEDPETCQECLDVLTDEDTGVEIHVDSVAETVFFPTGGEPDSVLGPHPLSPETPDVLVSGLADTYTTVFFRPSEQTRLKIIADSVTPLTLSFDHSSRSSYYLATDVVSLGTGFTDVVSPAGRVAEGDDPGVTVTPADAVAGASYRNGTDEVTLTVTPQDECVMVRFLAVDTQTVSLLPDLKFKTGWNPRYEDTVSIPTPNFAFAVACSHYQADAETGVGAIVSDRAISPSYYTVMESVTGVSTHDSPVRRADAVTPLSLTPLETAFWAYYDGTTVGATVTPADRAISRNYVADAEVSLSLVSVETSACSDLGEFVGEIYVGTEVITESPVFTRKEATANVVTPRFVNLSSSYCSYPVPEILGLRHNIVSCVKPLSNFLKLNSLSLEKRVTAYWKNRANGWVFDAHFEGKSADYSGRESWDLLVSLLTLNNLWVIQLKLRKKTAVADYVTTLNSGFGKTTVCSTAFGPLNFNYTVKTGETTPAPALRTVLNDENGYWFSGSTLNLLFESGGVNTVVADENGYLVPEIIFPSI